MKRIQKILFTCCLIVPLFSYATTDSTKFLRPLVSMDHPESFLLLQGSYGVLTLAGGCTIVSQTLPNPNNKSCPPNYTSYFDYSLLSTFVALPVPSGGSIQNIYLGLRMTPPDPSASTKNFVISGQACTQERTNTAPIVYQSKPVGITYKVFCLAPNF